MFCNQCRQNVPNDSEFCQYCGNKLAGSNRPEVIQHRPSQNTRPPKQKAAPLPLCTLLSMIVTVLCLIAAIAAMNLQDIRRNSREALNPTILYSVFIVILLAYLAMLFLAKNKKHSIFPRLFVFLPAAFTLFTYAEGSLFSKSFHANGQMLIYWNSDLVGTVNSVWAVLTFLLLIISLIGVLHSSYRRSIRYRESCYKHVENMMGFRDKGIISQEEFDKNKHDILKNIEL